MGFRPGPALYPSRTFKLEEWTQFHRWLYVERQATLEAGR